MLFENKRWLWLSLVVLISLAFLSLKLVRGVSKRAIRSQTWTTQTPRERGVYQNEGAKIKSDLIAGEETESSKLHKDFLRTAKRINMSDASGPLGLRPDGPRYRRNLSSVDFSPVLNM